MKKNDQGFNEKEGRMYPIRSTFCNAAGVCYKGRNGQNGQRQTPHVAYIHTDTVCDGSMVELFMRWSQQEKENCTSHNTQNKCFKCFSISELLMKKCR